MKTLEHIIPYYKDINEFLESISSAYRTSNPLFYCLRLKENDSLLRNFKPPFRKDFYFIGLVSNVGRTTITYDNTNITNLSSFLVFQSPGLIYSFYRDNLASGYLIYFKKECFSFFRPDLEKEFPFFDILHTHFYKINQEKFRQFEPYFEEVFTAYENANDNLHKIAAIKFLVLSYHLREFTIAFNQWNEGFTTPEQLLFQKYIQLVNSYYLEKRTLKEYAQLLFVTPNHLSKTIKSATGKNALSFINERIMTEANSLIQFAGSDIAEIAYHLNFSDPANFGKFFKKHSGMTPLDFRKKAARN